MYVLKLLLDQSEWIWQNGDVTVSGGNKSLLRHLSDIAAVQISLPERFGQEGSGKGYIWVKFSPISIFSKPYSDT